MKPWIFFVIAMLVIATAGATAPATTTLLADTDCEELMEEIEDKIKEMEKSENPPGREAKSLADLEQEAAKLAAEYLQKYGPEAKGHGGNVHNDAKELREKVAAAREAYYNRLSQLSKKLEGLNAKLKQYREDCEKDANESDRDKSREYKRKYERKAKAMAAEIDSLIEATATNMGGTDKELGRTPHETKHPDDDENTAEAKDDAYRERLKKRKKALPCYPDQKDGESNSAYRNRLEKWKKEFWEKVKKRIFKRFNDRIYGIASPPADDESAVPPGARNQRNYLVYSGAGLGVYRASFWEDQLVDQRTAEALRTSLYESEELMKVAFESLGDFFLGQEGQSKLLYAPSHNPLRQYYLEATLATSAAWEVSLQVGHAQAEQQVQFPVTIYRATDPVPELQWQSLRQDLQQNQIRLGGQYALRSAARWTPLVGLMGSWTHTRQQMTATLADLSWTVLEGTDTSWGYGLTLGLRYTHPSSIYLHLQAQAAQQQGQVSYGLQLAVGKYW
jgi:hypothetical protein